MADYIVGLTGGIGSGKTTIANMFSELGVPLIDADVIARELVAINAPAYNEIKQKFGSSILLENSELNRRKLREQVFSCDDDRVWLNNLLHPMIRDEMVKRAKKLNSIYAIMVVPLLFENGLQDIVNRVLVIDVPKSVQIARTISRDTINKVQVEAILKKQISRDDRLAKADDIVDNQGQIETLKTQVLALHKKYQILAIE